MQTDTKASTEQTSKEEAYWIEKLSGDLVRSNFHYDYRETVSNVRIVDSVEFRFSGDISSKALEYCRRDDLKLYALLTSVLVILLHKHSYSGSKDIIVGAPITKEGLGSRPTNTVLALRNQIEDKMTFSELILSVNKTIIEAEENRNFPIDELPDLLTLPVYGDDFPLFDVALSLENIHNKSHLRYFNINMIFSFFETGKFLEGVVEFNSSLFERDTVKKITIHFTNLLEKILSDIDILISEIEMLSEKEKHFLIYDLNDTRVPYPEDKSIPQMFEAQVAKKPGKAVLVFDDSYLTYSELNKRSNQLARVLREKGVEPDSVVPVFLDRSFQLVIAILGILKAGAAYLPIVVDTPAKRVRDVLEDCEPKLVISDEHFAGKLEYDGPKLDINSPGNYSEDTGNLVGVNPPAGLVYVIYTSGSTGKPKGVMLEQRNLINLMHFQFCETNIDFSKRILQFASIGFDVSAQELFSTVLGGGTLFLTTTEIKLDAPRLFRYAGKNDVNIFFMPPAFLNFVFANPGIIEKIPSSLRHIIAAGEQLTVSELFAAFLKENDVYLHNHYGPTESHVVTTLTLAPGDNIPEAPSIGKAITNNRMMILGRDNKNLQPHGVPGELYLCGVNVARGYSNRPEMTEERFMFNPYVENERMYKTGDLARWLPDGNIDFMGRIDFQVKIRGFRIEIGEIENQILKQEEQKIKETIVLAREDSAGEKYLCAYIVAEISVDISVLETSLGKNLPDYMIPSYFVQIDAMPLTPNGKIDRRALPDPRTIARKENFIAPQNEIEEKLVKIWSEVLNMKVDSISIDDDFFRLGGHSLKAAVMVTLIHKEFDVKMAMHEVFDMPCVRKLAEHIKGSSKEKYFDIPKASSKEFYLQTSAQKRLFFMDQLETNSVLYNIQMMDIYCKGIEKNRLEMAFKELIKRHESLRTSFHMVDGESVQQVHNIEEVEDKFAIEYYETNEDGMISSNQPGKEWTRVTGLPFRDVIEHFVQPFDLSEPCLMRVGLIKIMGAIQILMVDIHHIIADGVSLIIMIEELWELYEAKDLPPLNTQYKDFAEWSNSEGRRKEIQNQEGFWLKHFEGDIPVLNLPTDYTRPAKMTFDGDSLHFEVGKEIKMQLNTIAHENWVSLYMILLSAYYVLLAKLSGQEEIIIGTVTAGRGHADLQRVIGMFVDTIAIRNFPEGIKTFREFLVEVKNRSLAAFEHQEYPFEELVSKLATRSDSSRNPVFDVVFNLENESDQIEYLLDVLMLDKTNPYSYEVKKAKFDLVLIAVEKADGLQFNFEYNTNLFDLQTIERFAGYYKKILYSICRNADEKISQIGIIPGKEKHTILYDFNENKSKYPEDKTINELLEEQVALSPENLAVSGMNFGGWGEELTYSQFNGKVNQLARLLRKKGLKPDSLAAIMIEPSQEMIIAMFAILKAGGAFLPIKDGTPTDRIKYILSDSGARFLLTRNELKGDLDFQGDVILLDDADVFSGSMDNPGYVNKSGDMAYVIYTSGSTGKPKGVIIEHRALINLCFWHNKYYEVTDADHATKYAGFGFDASVWEVFPYLIIGAALYIVPEEIKLDIDALSVYFKENNITISFLPTQVCEQFMGTDNNSLRVLVTGGDKLKTFKESKFKLYNNYGPTENTVVATSYLVTELVTNIPIGKPLYNNQSYIVDKNNNLQPVGVPGELCIGGDSLARGYLNNPEMTQEKFVTNPFPPPTHLLQSPRLYRTGDLVRWLPNGNIEFLGRIDYQVKVRGFRIELGEIENQLLHIDDVKEAVVIARDDERGEKYLCAYVVPETNDLDISKVKQELAKHLTDYMIPSFFISMESIPLTANGKIDTRALPEPEASNEKVEYAPPTNVTEEKIASVWGEILSIENVGIDHNFFDLGGDSIKTILISAKLKKLGIDLHVNDFFSFPTIRELSNRIQKTSGVNEMVSVERDDALIARNIEKDYEIYLNHVENEKWQDLSEEYNYRHILLTGSTGYLGAYIVNELMLNTSATLYLLIRGTTQEVAQKRFSEKMSFYFGDSFVSDYKERLFVLKADLSEEKLGMDEQKYNELAEKVEVVIHPAALVKHFGLYEEFHKANVVGTEQLLDFALLKNKKAFHFVSTVDTGRGTIPGKDYLLFSEYNKDDGQESDNLYIKSKFEAEKRVLQYREKGLDTSIFRVSNMTFNSENGRFQENIEDNYFYSMLRALIKVGFWSDKMLDLEFDLSFINYSSKSIVLLMKKKQLKNEIYHICNPDILSWRDMAKLLKDSGVDIPDLIPEEIKNNLSKYEGNEEYERIIERVNVYSWEWEGEEKTITVPKMDRTKKILSEIGFEWPKVSREHIKKMIAYCKDVGFI